MVAERLQRSVTIVAASFAALILHAVSVQAANIVSGSGAVIGSNGEILTNSHVVEQCAQITVQFSTGNSEVAVLIARDEKNDLAVVRTKRGGISPSPVAILRDGSPVRAGDAVVALGYPLSGILASTANLSVGNVSALAGLHDDSRYLQITAPVQPGNSGGPLLDTSGHLVGIVTAKLDYRVARYTGDIPQNVNFALKVEVARTFLDSKGIAYQTAHSEQQLSPADVGDLVRPSTVHIKCEQVASRSAAAPVVSSPPRKSVEPTAQDLMRRCKSHDAQDRWIRQPPDVSINSCTLLIEAARAKRLPDKLVADAFQSRSNAYSQAAFAAIVKRGKGDREAIRSYDHAIADLTEAIRLNPEVGAGRIAGLLMERGRQQYEKKNYDRAIADLTEAIRLSPNMYAFLWRGSAYTSRRIMIVRSPI
jgi:S1-C subfamily serine protease